MAKIGTLTDAFATADGAKWNGYGASVTVAGGQLSIVPDSTFTRELFSATTYDVADSEAVIEVASLGSCMILSMNLQAGTSRFDLQYDNLNLRMREIVAGVISDTTTTYNATNHRWWRLRVAGASVYWEASPTGAAGTWAVLRSKAWAVPSITTMSLSIIAYTTSGTSPALLDNFNLPPAAATGTGSWWIAASHLWAPQSAVSGGGGGGTPLGPFSRAYYVSPSGNDANTGTSETAPWRTLNRALQTNYAVGEALLLETDGIYYGGYFNKTPTGSGGRFTIGYYGSGAKPILSAYKILDNAAAWTNMGGNVWRLDVVSTATHGGQQGQPAGVIAWNIGHLRVGSTTHGVLRTATSQLNGQWQFFGQNPYLYVYSAGNPTTVAASSGGLRAAPQSNVIQIHQNTEINGIAIVGTGGHGIANTGSGVTSNMVVKNCDISFCGGSNLVGTTRYGNGVEFWMGSSNCLVEGCDVSECYDAGLTVQGGGGDANGITFQQNTVHDCSLNFEFFLESGGRMFNILVANNTSNNGGGGWALPASVRPNQDWRCHVAFSGTMAQTPNPTVDIRNNVFDTVLGGSTTSYCFSLSPFPKPGVQMRSNTIRLHAGKRINFAYPQVYTIEQSAAYVAALGLEVGTTFVIL